MAARAVMSISARDHPEFLVGERLVSHRLLRRSVAALDAGVPLRDVQIFARHADPRTTTRYDRARNNLDRSATYVISAFLVGGS
jgi:hypothetical protein